MNKPVYLPFSSGKWQLKPGLKPLRLEDWIQIDEEYLPYLRRKAELRAERYNEVFAGLPGTEPAQQEVLDLLVDHLLQHFPDQFERSPTSITNHLTQETWRFADFATAPLDLAGRLVQEDLCLMMPNESGYILGAASLSFPSYWRLHDKLGRAIAPIHDPVPGYAQKLQHPVNTYFDRLQPEHPGYRINWSITGTSELFLGHHHVHRLQPGDITAENAGDKLWIRIEWQTLRRIPITRAILFGIHTYRYPIALLKQYPDAAAGLHSMLDQIPEDMQRYKSLVPIREALQKYLASII
ncbi:DUF3445 domain-containing protein [Oscillatoria sp. FACHB-1407]|uniref:heme-dependent oxidative N-demethylase family protein n=1 Tax=Oscillatoria sp. FACHB-1407 TaxID=2692847 RepID=UPI0016890A92|nr:DUF3445 domain-containing protein [Oscillatoria sp. FACHB-1407]MBD2463238.1 DUF3445 domain-containing protein [Oscillatoria sp. FACHB-1407]